MIPQHATNNSMGFAAPPLASAGADEDIFARTQRILEAARAVQVTADARPMMSFPNMVMAPPQPRPLVMQQMQAQQSPLVTKPQMTTAPMMMTAAPPAAATVSPTPTAVLQQQRRVSVVENISPVVQKAKRRASWLALLSKTDDSVAQSATAPPAAKKARVEIAIAEPAPMIKKQQPKRLPTKSAKSISTKKDATAKKGAAAAPKDDKPKRPLSAYNLFFRHERAVILMHEAQNPATSKDELLGDAVPVNRLPGQTTAQHRACVRSVLSDNPFHQDRKTRAHRKTHGKIGFTELVKLVAARWKRADDETKALYDDLSAEEKAKYNVAYKAWRARQPQDVLDRLDSKKSGGKKSPSPTTTKTIKTAKATAGKPKRVSPPTKKAILAKAAAADLSCFAPMPSLEPISDHDDFALLSDDELSAEEMDDLFPMPELAGGSAVHGMGVTGGVPSVAGGFDVAPLHGMAGIEAFPLDDSLVNFLTEFD